MAVALRSGTGHLKVGCLVMQSYGIFENNGSHPIRPTLKVLPIATF
jgi:hypothetical protein